MDEGNAGVAPSREVEWSSHPWRAQLLRFSLAITPVLGATLATYGTVRRYGETRLGLPFAAWILLLLLISATVSALMNRVVQRWLPLTRLLELNLLFPEVAPSRYRQALRSGRSRELQRRIASGQQIDDLASDRASYLLELLIALTDHHRFTRGHSERVRAYSDMIGEEMGLSRRDRQLLHWAALLHDVGKLDVPFEILEKPAQPNNAEWDTLKKHPEASTKYLAPIADWLGEWTLAAQEHHLRWDGTGYPTNTAGSDISLAGRIVAVADAYDVMTSARSYKKPLSVAHACTELTRGAGTQFDPAVVRAFLSLGLDRIRAATGPLSAVAALSQSSSRVVNFFATQATQVAQTAVTVTASAVGALAITTAVISPSPPSVETAAATPPAPPPAAGSTGTNTQNETVAAIVLPPAPTTSTTPAARASPITTGEPTPPSQPAPTAPTRDRNQAVSPKPTALGANAAEVDAAADTGRTDAVAVSPPPPALVVPTFTPTPSNLGPAILPPATVPTIPATPVVNPTMIGPVALPTATAQPTPGLQPIAGDDTPVIAPQPTRPARPTSTPRPTATARPTPTVQPIITPRPTPTVQPIITPRPTPTVPPIITPRPTPTTEPTLTPRPTTTVEPTLTPQPTATPTAQSTPIPTVQPTLTPRPTATVTPTPTPTATPAPTATPSPPAAFVPVPSQGSGTITAPDGSTVSYVETFRRGRNGDLVGPVGSHATYTFSSPTTVRIAAPNFGAWGAGDEVTVRVNATGPNLVNSITSSGIGNLAYQLQGDELVITHAPTGVAEIHIATVATVEADVTAADNDGAGINLQYLSPFV